MTELYSSRRALLTAIGAGTIGVRGTATVDASSGGRSVYSIGPETIHSVDADTGDENWWFPKPEGGSYQSFTVGDESVYVGLEETLYAYDARTGSKRWEETAESWYVDGEYTARNGRIYVPISDTNLRAMNANGSEAWVFADSSRHLTDVVEISDGTVLVVSYNNELYAIDDATGEREWAFTESGTGAQTSGHLSPAVVGNTIYHSDSGQGLYAIDRATGEQSWEYSISNSSFTTSPVVTNGVVYLIYRSSSVYSGTETGYLVAVDAASGKEIWEQRLSDPVDKPFNRVAIFFTDPTVVGDTIYVMANETSDGSVLIALDSETGEVEWRFTESSESYQTRVVEPNGDVYLATEERLFSIDPDEGDENWSFTAASAGRTSEIILTDSNVVFKSNDDTLYGIDRDSGEQQWQYKAPEENPEGDTEDTADEDEVSGVGFLGAFAAISAGAYVLKRNSETETRQ